MRPADRRGLLVKALLALCAVGAVLAGREPARAQQTTFRLATSAVAVDVSVRDKSRRTVTGLAASDFQVFDNGVLQQVDAVSYGQLPIDVTVALDVSTSVTGRLLDTLRRSVVQLMGDLGEDDRLKLMLFNMRVVRTVDFTNDVRPVEAAIRAVTAGGGTAFFDAVSVALVSAAAPDRRQLVVFFTDGNDSVSATTPDMLTSVAQRSRATLTFVTSGSAAPPVSVATNPALGMPSTTRSVVQVSPLLVSLARETGGSVFQVNQSTNLTDAFRRILADFRSAYVLYYNPQGVDRGGYHEIDVKVAREDASVLARRGYFGS